MIRARSEWVIRKRDGRVAPFDDGLIGRAISNAFRAELNLADGQPLDSKTDQEVREITEEVSEAVADDAGTSGGTDVERVQDMVEILLMKRGHYRVARRYIVYRAEHEKIRVLQQVDEVEGEDSARPQIQIKLEDGVSIPFDVKRIRRRFELACEGLDDCEPEVLLEEVMKSVFDGISVAEIYRAMILAARSRIEIDPAYDIVAARLLRMVIANEALGSAPLDHDEQNKLYRNQFEH